MSKPAWQENILACYPALLRQIEAVDGVKKVEEAEALAQLTSVRQQLPLDGAVYVVLDGFTPATTNDNNRAQMIEISFSVILVKQHYTPRPQTAGVGETLTALAKALQGFDPIDEKGKALVTQPFQQKSALPIQYEDGFAYFPLRFAAQVAIIS